jgi:hypothetical protein
LAQGAILILPVSQTKLLRGKKIFPPFPPIRFLFLFLLNKLRALKFLGWLKIRLFDLSRYATLRHHHYFLAWLLQIKFQPGFFF